MLNMSHSAKIYVYTPVADMRKGVNGLSGIIRSEFGADPTDGSLFVFMNRRHDRMKILHFDGGGFWLYYRLLEAGTFEEVQGRDDSSCLVIDGTQLAMLLSGVSLTASHRRRKRYSRHRSEQAA
jgi:transposase